MDILGDYIRISRAMRRDGESSLADALLAYAMNKTIEHRQELTSEYNRICCNICGETEFSEFKNRGKIKCTCCGSNERHRSYKLYFENIIKIKSGVKILHFAPENKHIFKWFAQKKNVAYHPFDFNTEKYKKFKHGSITVKKFDLCHDTYHLKENQYDYIIHNHVLEHLPCDYQTVLSQLHRSLKHSGLHMFSVPIIGNTYDECLDTLDNAERSRRFGQEDHVRVFGRKDIYSTIGHIFNIRHTVAMTLMDMFGQSVLEKYNIPRGRWQRFSGACMFLLKKTDINETHAF